MNNIKIFMNKHSVYYGIILQDNPFWTIGKWRDEPYCSYTYEQKLDKASQSSLKINNLQLLLKQYSLYYLDHWSDDLKFYRKKECEIEEGIKI